MQYKIKYFYLCDYSSIDNLVSGEDILSDIQIKLLRDAIPKNLNYYSIILDNGTKFVTYYDRDDFLDITEEKLEQWNNE